MASKFDRNFIDTYLFKEIDWKSLEGINKQDIIIALMFELNKQLAMLQQLLENPSGTSPEEGQFRCPNCIEDVSPTQLGYCPKCKTDLARIYPDKIHVGKDIKTT